MARKNCLICLIKLANLTAHGAFEELKTLQMITHGHFSGMLLFVCKRHRNLVVLIFSSEFV